MRIALFGGTFDPVHHGHLMLAQDAVEQLGLNKLIFLPAQVNPHKIHAAPRAEAAHRLKMLRAAVAGEERFEVSSIELEREGPSFSVDTVQALQENWPEARFFFLLGADNLPKLPTWHRFDDLRKLVEFVCFGRNTEGNAVWNPLCGSTLERRLDISSTEIRQRIAAGLSIRYLVPESVRAFIYAHSLYQPSHE
jgi:nicotinate-nucleotide adenylyltransferase